MLTIHSPIRLALGLLGRLRIVARLGLLADLDTTISNVSPLTPICKGRGIIPDIQVVSMQSTGFPHNLRPLTGRSKPKGRPQPVHDVSE